ncbi:alpha/beta hydrolase [Rhodococcus olei]|uniref:Alpha/beta hydrolase n=1 Tax=Rhodococcus olei TaxID=2161675 RepID=A0ABP8P0J6_9NOCA
MRTLGLAALVMAVCCACGAGPSVRPDVAVVEHRDGATTEPSGVDSATATRLPAPAHDLAWRDCTDSTLDAGGLRPGPAGLVFECADVVAPIDSAGPALGVFTLGVLRARLPQTPVDAAPLVVTSGADRASTATLAALAAGPVGTLLSTRPLVAVDRRGTGTSTPIECGKPMTAELRRQMLDLGQFTPPPVAGGDAADTVLTLGRDATTACTDFLQPHELAFDAAHAADDLEQVRRAWEVDRIGLLATGSGADVAVAYATAHPGALGRLVLDSPAVVRADATTTAEARIRGAQAALAAFARQCVALECSLGPDPVAAVTDLTNRARRGELGTISSNALLTAISDHLGSPRADVTAQVREFADVLAAAGRGDTGALQSRIDAAAAATGSDGLFVARCSDGRQWPTPGRVRELMRDWGEKYPVFGPEGVLQLLLCASWPTTPTPSAPTTATTSALAIAGVADPVAGAGAPSVTGVLASVGTPTSTVAWLGSGHPAVSHSQCVQLAVAGYAQTAALPPDGGACPG